VEELAAGVEGWAAGVEVSGALVVSEVEDGEVGEIEVGFPGGATFSPNWIVEGTALPTTSRFLFFPDHSAMYRGASL